MRRVSSGPELMTSTDMNQPGNTRPSGPPMTISYRVPSTLLGLPRHHHGRDVVRPSPAGDGRNFDSPWMGDDAETRPFVACRAGQMTGGAMKNLSTTVAVYADLATAETDWDAVE